MLTEVVYQLVHVLFYLGVGGDIYIENTSYIEM